jgi:hypothetical protein
MDILNKVMMRDVMFHANDSQEHTLCFSPVGRYWRIENPEVGEVATFNCFGTAFNHLMSYSDPATWSVSDNPY